MKYLQVILALLLSALSLMVKPVNAQQAGQQMERINRDINIMESILREMFKIKPASATGGFDALPAPFSAWNNEERIEGVYVDGYGIILFIPNPASSDMLLVSLFGEENFTYSFYYGGNNSPDSILSKESVISQITAFFTSYAPASVTQLQPDERLTVLFGGHPSEHVRRRVQLFTRDSDSAKPFLQTISVTALKSDLAAYQNDQLSKEAFRQRLRISSKDSDESESLDLKIMANILKTALTEDGEQHVRIGKDINFLELNDFGAIFFLDIHLFPFPGSTASFRSAPTSGILRFHTSGASGTFNPDSIASIDVKRDKDGSAVITYHNKDGSKVTRSSGGGSSMDTKNEELGKAYKQLLEDMKAYLVDYGRTLNSVRSEQTILLSASLTSPSFADSIPDHVDIQIKKSVLEAISKGDLSREEAIGQIVVREY